jgi:hypothetical protein
VRAQRSRLRFGGACRRDRNAVRLAWSVDQLICVASFEGVASAARYLSIGEQKRGGWQIVTVKVVVNKCATERKSIYIEVEVHRRRNRRVVSCWTFAIWQRPNR